MPNLSNKYIGKIFADLQQFEKHIFFPLAGFIVRIQYRIHVTEEIRVKRLFMWSGWLLVNITLFVVKFQGSQNLFGVFGLHGGQRP